MSGFGFGGPLWLVLAPVALALGPLALALAERSARRARALTRQPPRPRRAGIVALALAVALAAVAAAQPRWGERTVAVPTGGARVVAVLDVSRSMGVTDVAPSRLAAARAAVTGAFRALSGDRAALIVFAGDARVRFPLTRDLDAAAVVVENVRGGALLLERGTLFVVSDFLTEGYERALRAAARRFDVIAVRIREPLDGALPAAGVVRLVDAEGGPAREVDSDAGAVRDAWAARVRAIDAARERLFGELGIDEIRVVAGEDYVRALLAFFRRRTRAVA